MRGGPPKYLVWLDLETGGLIPARDPVLEVGYVVSFPTPPFQRFDSFSAVVRPTEPLVLDDIVRDMHQASGLLAELDDGDTVAHVQANAAGQLAEWGDPGEFMLAGSGVARFDRRFLDEQLPDLNQWFRPHDEMDIGSVRRLLKIAGRDDLLAVDTAAIAHRALPDAISHHNEFCAYVNLVEGITV